MTDLDKLSRARREKEAAQSEAARAMLAALEHARRVFGDRTFQSHSENLVWIEIGDAIAQAKAAGIKP